MASEVSLYTAMNGAPVINTSCPASTVPAADCTPRQRAWQEVRELVCPARFLLPPYSLAADDT